MSCVFFVSEFKAFLHLAHCTYSWEVERGVEKQNKEWLVILVSLNVRAFTWNRDSHGLFDYESQSVTKKTFRVKTDGRLFRVGNEVKLTDNHYPRDDSVEGDHLLSVSGKGELAMTCQDETSTK